MDPHIIVALIATLVNLILSSTVPCLLNKSNQPFLNDVRTVFQTNRQSIIASSVIVGITTYLSLKLVEDLQESGFSLSETRSEGLPIIISNQIPGGLRNLLKLRD